MNSEKMKKAAGNLDILAKVVGGIFTACGIVCLVFIVLVAILGEKMYAPGSLSLDADFLDILLAPEYQAVTPMMKLYTIVGLISVAVICFTLRFICLYLRAILNPIKDGRPFEADIPIYIRRIAWLSLISGVITQLAGVAERMILTRALPMEEIFSSPAVAGIEYNFTFDIGFVWIFVLLMFLSYIFSYGQALQQEADETL